MIAKYPKGTKELLHLVAPWFYIDEKEECRKLREDAPEEIKKAWEKFKYNLSKTPFIY